jgi:uncharacterized protein YecE (DUF72 family)
MEEKPNKWYKKDEFEQICEQHLDKEAEDEKEKELEKPSFDLEEFMKLSKVELNERYDEASLSHSARDKKRKKREKRKGRIKKLREHRRKRLKRGKSKYDQVDKKELDEWVAKLAEEKDKTLKFLMESIPNEEKKNLIVSALERGNPQEMVKRFSDNVIPFYRMGALNVPINIMLTKAKMSIEDFRNPKQCLTDLKKHLSSFSKLVQQNEF